MFLFFYYTLIHIVIFCSAYQKHYPPSLDDEVWRLEQIAKDGPTHEKLNDFGISTVRDLLRLYATDQLKLRTVRDLF